MIIYGGSRKILPPPQQLLLAIAIEREAQYIYILNNTYSMCHNFRDTHGESIVLCSWFSFNNKTQRPIGRNTQSYKVFEYKY